MPLILHPKAFYHKIQCFWPNKRLEPSLLKQVISQYDFEAINFNQKSAGGYRGLNIIIKTSDGIKILKQYKPTLGDSTIAQEHSILKYLSKAGFPVPLLKKTKSGDTLLQIEKQKFALFDFIAKGYHYNNYLLLPGQADDHIKTAGRTLGYLHKLLNNFNPLGYNPDGFKSKGGDRWRTIEWFADRMNYCIKASNCFSGSEDNRVLLSHADFLNEQLFHLDDQLKRKNLRFILIHGDYTPFNLLYTDISTAFVLDFEMARLDWLLIDIVRSWQAFCSNKSGFDLEKMETFLDAYQLHMSIFEDELSLIPEVWSFFCIINFIQSWKGYFDSGSSKRLGAACRFLNALKWMDDHRKIIAEFKISRSR
jgi:Ser/Thr protein kinase RdoA (MazF antagonist)